jgi:hypothetical protein
LHCRHAGRIYSSVVGSVGGAGGCGGGFELGNSLLLFPLNPKFQLTILSLSVCVCFPDVISSSCRLNAFTPGSSDPCFLSAIAKMFCKLSTGVIVGAFF